MDFVSGILDLVEASLISAELFCTILPTPKFILTKIIYSTTDTWTHELPWMLEFLTVFCQLFKGKLSDLELFLLQKVSELANSVTFFKVISTCMTYKLKPNN